MRRLFASLLPTRTARISAGVLAAMSVALCFVPGFGSLGYYSSLALALVGGVLTGLVGASVARRTAESQTGTPGGPRVSTAFWAAARTTLALLAVPPLVLLFNSLWVKNCDPIGSVGFYVAGAGLSMLFASQVGAFAGLWRRRTGQGLLLFVAFWLAFVLRDLAHLYLEPPIFAYNAFAGFFSGAVYDDLIELDGRLAAFRLSNLAQLAVLWGAAALLWDPAERRFRLARLSEGRVRTWAALVAAVVVAAGLHGARGHLGFEIDRAHIERVLGGRLENDRIVLVYDRDVIPPDEARRLLEDHTYRLEQLDLALGERFPERITSYVYGSSRQKRRMMGADRVYIAKPWVREIHINRVPYGAAVIHHELAHVVLGAWAPGPLHVPARMWLFPHMAIVEGAAEAMEWYGGSMTLHQWSAAMRREGLAPDLASIMGPDGFWSQAAGKAYTLSGSFIRYLLDTHGPAPFRALYGDGDFEAAYGRPLPALIAEWEAFIDGVPLPDDALALARERFDVKGIFHRTCPLEIARLEAQASALADAGEYDGAIALHRQIVRFVPKDARKRVPIVELLARRGDADGTQREVAELLALGNVDPVTRAYVRELSGDALWRAGKYLDALKLYQTLAAEPQSEDRLRNVLVKAAVLASGQREPILGPYLLGRGSRDAVEYLVAAVADLPGDTLALYLLGRRLSSEDVHAEAVRVLRAVIAALDGADGGPDRGRDPLDDALRRESLRLMARSLFYVGELEEAERAFLEAAQLSPKDGQRLWYQDWASRAQWLKKRLRTAGNFM